MAEKEKRKSFNGNSLAHHEAALVRYLEHIPKTSVVG